MTLITINGDNAFIGLLALLLISICGYVTLFQSRYNLKKENDYLRQYLYRIKRRIKS